MLSPDLKRLLHLLEWETKKKFHSNSSGSVIFAKQGKGLNFKEVRSYVYGDDTRYIDWNVTSRTGDLHVKEFYKETDNNIIIFADFSNSMTKKKRYACFQLSLFLSLFHTQNGNKINFIPFAEKPLKNNRTLKTEMDCLKCFSNLDYSSIGEETNFKAAFEYGYKVAQKHSIVYWISDFMNFSGKEKIRSKVQHWEQNAIWIEDDIDTISKPWWFKLLSIRSQESQTALTKKNTLKKDQNTVRAIFNNKIIYIHPDKKIATQLLPIFQKKL
ncbi:DUF58 domain-containing protein [Leptospira sp. 96542]|nr:DUF58 domain-containing protein [Leptospira sp. 96542]